MNTSNFINRIKHTVKAELRLFSDSVFQEPYTDKSRNDLVSNLRKNWYFPISSMAFFCLSAALNLGYILGLLFSFSFALFVSAQIPSLWTVTQKYSIRLRIFSLISAVGICLSVQSSFYTDLMDSSKTQALKAMLPVTAIDIPAVATYIAAVIALFFVYFCLLIFWNTLIMQFAEAKVFSNIGIAEKIIYALLLTCAFVLMVLCFAKTEAFYGNDYVHDIIYTSDSRMLVKWNAYMCLTHQENDLRQPLFAVFSAPFTAIPYLVSRLTGASSAVHSMLMNSVQILLLFVSSLLLCRMLHLDAAKRVCFMALSFFTYAQLLFILMMEQYIISCFWLLFCIYLIEEKQKPSRIALWGTGGTLLPGLIFLPFMSKESPVRNFKSWFLDMVKYGLEFVALLLAFSRFDVIFNLFSRIDYLSKFTGESISFTDKLYQYTHFIKNCFFAPNAGAFTDARGNISWQLEPAADISFAGVAILLLVAISALRNRDKKSSLLAAGWIGFSATLLLGLGWGTNENGLILYALYFGWAFLVLLFQLIETIEDKFHVRFLIPVTTIAISTVMLAINLPAVMELITFAITYFPV